MLLDEPIYTASVRFQDAARVFIRQFQVTFRCAPKFHGAEIFVERDLELTDKDSRSILEAYARESLSVSSKSRSAARPNSMVRKSLSIANVSLPRISESCPRATKISAPWNLGAQRNVTWN